MGDLRPGTPPGGLPKHAPLARRLGDRVGDDSARSPPRRLTLASVFGEPALVREGLPMSQEPALLTSVGRMPAANVRRRDVGSPELSPSQRLEVFEHGCFLLLVESIGEVVTLGALARLRCVEVTATFSR